MNLFDWIYLSYLYLGHSLYALIGFLIIAIVMLVIGIRMSKYQKKLHQDSKQADFNKLTKTEIVKYNNLCAYMIMSGAGTLIFMLFAMQSNQGGLTKREVPLAVNNARQDQHLISQMQTIKNKIQATHSQFFKQQLQQFYNHDQNIIIMHQNEDYHNQS